MEITMSESDDRTIDLPVTFVGMEQDEHAPRFAVYAADITGRPARKLSTFDGKTVPVPIGHGTIIFGPDVEDFTTLPKDSFVMYRLEQKLETWREQGILLPRNIWDRFHFHFSCVSGTVQKCRPWF